jgi:hypothetical protein
MTHIFLSRPTWVPHEFSAGLAAFVLFLKSIGLNPRTLGSTDYPHQSPLDEVIRIMGDCEAAVILGYPQIEIASGKLKDKPLNCPILLGTEWNHIEAALAYSKSLPLLVIHHQGVTRGIFDRGTLNSFVHEIDLTAPAWCLDEGTNGAVQSWKSRIGQASKSKLSPEQLIRNASIPICPNCSTSERTTYLRTIPIDFIEIENATHECPACSWKGRF